jgi:hypothetical protein
MTGEPPLARPAPQINPIWFPFVIASTSSRFIGASGTVIMTAPFPSTDSKELPTALVATTLAQTDELQSR